MVQAIVALPDEQAVLEEFTEGGGAARGAQEQGPLLSDKGQGQEPADLRNEAQEQERLAGQRCERRINGRWP